MDWNKALMDHSSIIGEFKYQTNVVDHFLMEEENAR